MDRHKWNERYAAQPLLWNVDPGPFLGGEVGERPPGHALDLGAGEGRTALWLAGRGWRVTAVDFSDVALDRGRRRAEELGVAERIDWVCADLLEFDPTGGPYDLVLMMFIHLRQPERRRLMRAAAEALAPGGTFLIAGYDSRHRIDGQGGPRDPEILFTPEDLVADLDGLRIERAESITVGDVVDAIVRAVRD